MEDELWKKQACANLREQNVPFKNHMRYLHVQCIKKHLTPNKWTKNYLTLHMVIFVINIWLWHMEEVHQS